MKSVPATLFFKVMKEPPTVFPFGPIAELIAIPKRPYRPGEKCYVREGWRLDNGVIVYKSDCIPSFRKYHAWKSSVIMPAKYARRFVTVLSCEPVRVSEVTEEDIIKAGLADGSCVWANGAARCNAKGDLVVNQFVDNWHKRHPDKEWAWRVEGKEEK